MLFFTSGEYTLFIKCPLKALRALLWAISVLLIGYLHLSPKNETGKVSISGNNIPLEEVFRTIHKQTAYDFTYADLILKHAKNITVNIKDVDIEEAMYSCLEGQGLDFSIINKTITIVIKSSHHRK